MANNFIWYYLPDKATQIDALKKESECILQSVRGRVSMEEDLSLAHMDVWDFIHEAVNYATEIKLMEFVGMVFGLLCVWFLIKQNIMTWPTGIIYVLISLVIFIKAKLYADFILHIFFLVLNVYGWYYWVTPANRSEAQLQVTSTKGLQMAGLLILSAVGVIVSAKLLVKFTDASLPYWDSATSILSISAMWLTAKKKIENWIIWLGVDVLATGIYYYKGLYFYGILYLIYTGMAIAGYLSWRRSMNLSLSTA
jgi:nicotinamide mononucleotide transporter